jgi:hypothetical protein
MGTLPAEKEPRAQEGRASRQQGITSAASKFARGFVAITAALSATNGSNETGGRSDKPGTAIRSRELHERRHRHGSDSSSGSDLEGARSSIRRTVVPQRPVTEIPEPTKCEQAMNQLLRRRRATKGFKRRKGDTNKTIEAYATELKFYETAARGDADRREKQATHGTTFSKVWLELR